MDGKSLAEYLVELLSLGAIVATGVTSGDAQQGAQISSALLSIIQKTIAAHEAVTGQPIDPSLLKPFTPIP
jgi:hypothetical protein